MVGEATGVKSLGFCFFSSSWLRALVLRMGVNIWSQMVHIVTVSLAETSALYSMPLAENRSKSRKWEGGRFTWTVTCWVLTTMPFKGWFHPGMRYFTATCYRVSLRTLLPVDLPGFCFVLSKSSLCLFSQSYYHTFLNSRTVYQCKQHKL